MNLAPAWIGFLGEHGFEAAHWSAIGDSRATDSRDLMWAHEHGYVVFTHDLDFSALLANAALAGPSVIQLRSQDVLPDAAGSRVIAVLREYADALAKGAIVTIDEVKERVRILPTRARRSANP